MTECVVELVEILLREREDMDKNMSQWHFLKRTGPVSKPVLRNDNGQPTAHAPQISTSLHHVTQFVHLSYALKAAGGVHREAAVMQVRLFNDGAWLDPKRVSLSNTTIAAISSNETQREVFRGLHYPKEPPSSWFGA